jgi:positive regulator of sigma E activity
MNLDYSEILINAMLEVIPPMIDFFLPIFLWILIPGTLAFMLFKSKDAYTVGGILGLVGAFTIGPLSSNPIF